jgi:threonine dehydrogenase-like Zn-dependent dehydrogenase
MKSIAVFPGRPNSVHLADLPMPRLEDIPGGRGVLVRVLRCGVDGTDKEINAAEYGRAPKGESILVLGHENFGRVEAIGPGATGLSPGDFVVATVRRPGTSVYDAVGLSDLTTDDVYLEHGISLLHGFLTEYYVDAMDYIVPVPAQLRRVGVLVEPMSVAEKGIMQAYEIQRRLRVWRPQRAAVLGAGSIGLLATLILRLRGLDVTAFGQRQPPYRNAGLIEELGARYISTRTVPLEGAARVHGPFDIIFEATGFSPLAFEAMEALGKNGVLVLASVTGGDRRIEIPADRINLGFVLGNKVAVGTVNSNRAHFEAAVADLAAAEIRYGGWTAKLLTHPVYGLEHYQELFDILVSGKDVIKAYMEVATVDAVTP